MRVLKLIAALTGAGIAVVLATVYSGVIDVGATTPHGTLANWLLTTTMRQSVERHARSVELPADFDDGDMWLAGAGDFSAMCDGCHGGPGQAVEAMGQGLNPPAPDLAEAAARMSPEELFWVTRNGIRMTGMPAWGASHDDEALWPVVAFMTCLPGMTPAEYESAVDRGASVGHHAPGQNGDHGHGEMGEPDAAHTGVAADGHAAGVGDGENGHDHGENDAAFDDRDAAHNQGHHEGHDDHEH
ncbi:MAG: cytochrome c [Wenzhouxiangellaceae bacterium]